MSAFVEAGLAGALQQVERAVDEQLDRLDSLGDQDLAMIRRKRMQEMKREAEEKRQWVRLGHGELSFLSEKDFFTVAKESDRVVVCFHRPGSSRYSDDLVNHLRKIANYHLETKFVVLDAENSPFLTDRLKIWCLPSISLIMKGKTDKTFHGLNEISSKGALETTSIEQILFDQKILHNTAIADELACVGSDDE
ncbi:hypothetical protein NDN08_001815 [Rhodosorus marinus]|uniref:Thioredoxin domain-containing protein n=1 Tax=Rhodosorus marinus TaxID=101924 RepID=A0AAV8UUQ1_9RHOD|nr:hypothetical protein NDN08_001815 [Rhodosorus marinus]